MLFVNFFHNCALQYAYSYNELQFFLLLAAGSKGDKATVSAINYTDIPHTQVRKGIYF